MSVERKNPANVMASTKGLALPRSQYVGVHYAGYAACVSTAAMTGLENNSTVAPVGPSSESAIPICIVRLLATRAFMVGLAAPSLLGSRRAGIVMESI